MRRDDFYRVTKYKSVYLNGPIREIGIRNVIKCCIDVHHVSLFCVADIRPVTWSSCVILKCLKRDYDDTVVENNTKNHYTKCVFFKVYSDKGRPGVDTNICI